MIVAPHYALIELINARNALSRALRRLEALEQRHPPRSWRRSRVAGVAVMQAVRTLEIARARDTRWWAAMHRARPHLAGWIYHAREYVTGNA